MLTLDTLRHEKRAEILRLAGLHGCRNVRVFGSVANGENRPDSDVDFLVDMESGRTIFDLAGFMGDISGICWGPRSMLSRAARFIPTSATASSPKQ